MLTLRKLERDGLVTALADWAVTHHDAIQGSRARYDTDRPARP
jgi:hypothetical protein